jgi:hypothetical protein
MIDEILSEYEAELEEVEDFLREVYLRVKDCDWRTVDGAPIKSLRGYLKAAWVDQWEADNGNRKTTRRYGTGAALAKILRKG